ncbi:MAG: hypothetical protein EAZ91_02325 [Cytophagales bacterium]|nr:MAG: hypothetical protein EAZ91_02325 [Cytophagales bacterium]
MGNFRPIPVKCWIAFLKAHGCTFKSKQGTSHDKWRCPNCIQSIIFRGAEKEIPFAHIATNLTTMGRTKEYFLDWIAQSC